MEKIQFSYLLVGQTKSLIPQAVKFTKDPDTASDLIQDTITKAYLNCERFTEGTNIKGWLYTIMRNLFINTYRKKSPAFLSLEREYYSVVNSIGSVENEAEASIMNEHINRILKTLPRQYYEPLKLYSEGYKYEEITEMLSMPEGTVKNRIHLARKFIREPLARLRQSR